MTDAFHTNTIQLVYLGYDEDGDEVIVKLGDPGAVTTFENGVHTVFLGTVVEFIPVVLGEPWQVIIKTEHGVHYQGTLHTVNRRVAHPYSKQFNHGKPTYSCRTVYRTS